MRVKNKKAFSTPELMVSTLIFTFMLGGLYTALLAGNVSWSSHDSNVRAQQEVRKTIESMGRDFREAENIIITSVSGVLTVSFTIPGEGNISYSWNSVGGTTDSNQVIRQTSSATRIIAQDIVVLTVTNNSSDVIVTAAANVSTAQGGQIDNFQLTSKVAKR